MRSSILPESSKQYMLHSQQLKYVDVFKYLEVKELVSDYFIFYVHYYLFYLITMSVCSGLDSKKPICLVSFTSFAYNQPHS